MPPRRAALLGPVLLAMLLSGCSAGPAGRTATTAPPTPASVATAEPAAASSAPVPQRIASSASGWFAGVEVTTTGSSFDPGTGRITVEATARNTSNHDLDILDDVFLDLGDGGAHLPLSGIGPTAVKRSTTAVSFVFGVPTGTVPDLGRAVLQLGDVDQQRWLVPLAPGAAGDGVAPSSRAVHDAFTANGFAFTISRIEVVPWACDVVHTEDGIGTTDYAPIATGKRALLVWVSYTERASVRGGDTITEVSIQQPDGLAAKADPRTLVQDHGDRVEEIPWCIAADEPVRGSYTLRWTTYASGSGSHRITVP